MERSPARRGIDPRKQFMSPLTGLLKEEPSVPSAREGVKKSLSLAVAAAPLDVRKACGFPASGPA